MQKIQNKYSIKKIAKILTIIFLMFFNLLNLNIVKAEEWKTSLCWAKEWKDRYDCQIKNFCEVYKVKEPTHKWEDYFESDSTWEESLFKTAKKKYRENQNWIYACGVIKIQKNSYKLVKNKLVKIDKTWKVVSKISEKIDLKLKKLKIIWKEKDCISSENKEEENRLQTKTKLLNESAYEFCKYNFYLNFLQNHYKNINNANQEFLWKNKEKNSFKIWKVAKIQSKLQKDLVDEISHSERVFELAFSTYIDYENNHPVHILLELIKEDFYVLRQKLHEMISPINQVVYKISNAMSID